ncbi:MAG: mannitol dehydrogenase family protein [Oscillospiraceae bacterium]|nr:mannitol dehydrogenase family protein [Oscillospiraceae bacterium]
MDLNYCGIKDRNAWAAVGIRLPSYDPAAVAERTMQSPVWLHFSAGNIFRAYIAALQDRLLNEGHAECGIIAVEAYDPEILDKVYKPHDNLCLVVTLKPETGGDTVVDGGATVGSGMLAGGGAAVGSGMPAGSGAVTSKYTSAINGVVIGSIAQAYNAIENDGYEAVRRAFVNPGLQVVSYTITEKAYLLRGPGGEYLRDVGADMDGGPDRPKNIMALTATMLHERYKAGAWPISLVSMDNCSRNGERLRSSVLEIASSWAERGLCAEGFADWLGDESRVAFPWSMIDKITPWPSETIANRLTAAGIPFMAPVKTKKGTVVAPFVNTEPAQYLVIEDNFPNGRPPLEKAGVTFADRDTVNRAEWMKVATCLNPLHTTLAIFGFLLDYDSIADEMKDAALLALVRRIAYDEGLPAVADPGVIDPRAFLDEAVNERLPNPMIPDAPPRIAADTSQKIAIRFGGTIRYYMGLDNASKNIAGTRTETETEAEAEAEADVEADETQGWKPSYPGAGAGAGTGGTPAIITSPADLVGVPLTLAGWLRYLLAFDDALNPYTPSPDPMLGTMQNKLSEIIVLEQTVLDSAYADKIKDILAPILADASLFGADLHAAGLADKVTAMFISMLEGKGAVRRTLEKYL